MADEIKPMSVSLPSILIKEIDEFVGGSRKYRNRSHFAQIAFENLLAEEARTDGA